MIKDIIKSTNEEYVNKSIDKVINKEIDRIKNISGSNIRIQELLNIPKYKKDKGLPIGNMTSQILAIFYLNDLDHYIKEKLYCKYYIRYMDDFIIFDTDKEKLKRIKNIISIKLKEYKLELNKKTNIYNLNKGFNFLGYTFILKNKKLIIKITSKTKRRLIKKFKYLNKNKVNNLTNVKASYKGYLKFSNCKSLINKLNIK